MERLRSAWMEDEWEFSSGFVSISRRMWWGSCALKHFCNLETSRWQLQAHKAGGAFSDMLLHFPFPVFVLFLLFFSPHVYYNLLFILTCTFLFLYLWLLLCTSSQSFFLIFFFFFFPSCLCFFVLVLFLVYSLCSWACSPLPISTNSQCS